MSHYMDFFKFAGRVIERYAYWQGTIGGYLFLPLTLYVAYGCFARYVLRIAVPGMIEIPSYTFLVALALSAALSMKLGGHIRVTLIIDKLSRKSKNVFDLICLIASFIFCAFICWACAVTALQWFQSNNISADLGLPLSLLMALVVIGFLTLCLEIIVELASVETKMKERDTIGE
jgi:TRAP-type C4-dicarboxylate transport system permease small subunit